MPTPQQQKIIDEAMSGAAYSAISPEAQQYRSYGTFAEPTPPAPVEKTAEQLAAERIANANAHTTPVDPYQTALETAYGGVSGAITDPAADAARIRQETQQRMQAQIDAINAAYAAIVAREEQAGVGRLGMTRAITARQGTLGETFGEQAMEGTREATRKVIAGVQAEKGEKIAALYGKIEELAATEIRARKAEALGYLGELQKVRENNKTSAQDIAKLLTPADLKAMPEDKYKALLSNTGWDAWTIERIAAANAKTEVSDFNVKVQDNSLITTWWDKTTGQPKIQVEDLSKYGITSNEMTNSHFDPDTGAIIFWNEKTQTSKVVKPEGYTPTPEKPTETAKTRALKTQAFALVRPELEKPENIRTDGYVDPKVYMRLRSDWAEVIGSVADFDATFASMLSPTERARLGVGKAVGVEAIPEEEEAGGNPFIKPKSR